jgi:hypothetical protein
MGVGRNVTMFRIGSSIAEAVSRWLPTAATRVQSRVWSSGICGGQSRAGAGFLRVLRFPLPIIPPNSPNSPSSQSPGAGTIGRTVSGRRAEWTQFGLHPPLCKLKKMFRMSHTHLTAAFVTCGWGKSLVYIQQEFEVGSKPLGEAHAIPLQHASGILSIRSTYSKYFCTTRARYFETDCTVTYWDVEISAHYKSIPVFRMHKLYVNS